MVSLIVTGTRECAVCKKEFAIKAKNQLSCSSECANLRIREQLKTLAARRKTQRRPLGLKRICEVCGKNYPVKADNQKYCNRVKCKREGVRRVVKRQTEQAHIKMQKSVVELVKTFFMVPTAKKFVPVDKIPKKEEYKQWSIHQDWSD